MDVIIVIPGRYNDTKNHAVRRKTGDLHTTSSWYGDDLIKRGFAVKPGQPWSAQNSLFQEGATDPEPEPEPEAAEAEEKTPKKATKRGSAGDNPFL